MLPGVLKFSRYIDDAMYRERLTKRQPRGEQNPVLLLSLRLVGRRQASRGKKAHERVPRATRYVS